MRGKALYLRSYGDPPGLAHKLTPHPLGYSTLDHVVRPLAEDFLRGEPLGDRFVTVDSPATRRTCLVGLRRRVR